MYAHGPVVIQAGVEELDIEGQFFGGPDGLFRTEAYGMPVAMIHLGEEFRDGRSSGIGGAGKILRFGLHIGKGEGGNVGRGRLGLEAEGRQQAEGGYDAL